MYGDAAGKVIEKQAQVGQRVQRGDVLARFIQDVPGLEFSPIAIETPVSGVIMSDEVEVGAKITPQRPCFVIGTLDTLFVNVRLIESDYRLVRSGQSCTVTAPALPGEQFAGKVVRIEPQVDSRTRTAVAVVRTANRGDRLRPGMAAVCEFTAGSRKALTLPYDAVIRVGAGYRIVKVVDGRARIAEVRCGEILEREIEVLEGLSPNDLVVSYGQNLLQEGMPVTLVP